MSVYFTAQIKIINEAGYQKYLEKCDDIFSKYGGRYLSVDSSPEKLEGNWNYTRSILIEFPSKKDFDKWYYSEDYQEILKHRLSNAVCDSILIKGI